MHAVIKLKEGNHQDGNQPSRRGVMTSWRKTRYRQIHTLSHPVWCDDGQVMSLGTLTSAMEQLRVQNIIITKSAINSQTKIHSHLSLCSLKAGYLHHTGLQQSLKRGHIFLAIHFSSDVHFYYDSLCINPAFLYPLKLNKSFFTGECGVWVSVVLVRVRMFRTFWLVLEV